MSLQSFRILNIFHKGTGTDSTGDIVKEVKDGEQISSDWDNQAWTYNVQDGCVLTMYEDIDDKKVKTDLPAGNYDKRHYDSKCNRLSLQSQWENTTYGDVSV